VPVISTLCPTCGVSFASSASRRYSLATAVLDVVPDVPVAPADALVNTNFASVMLLLRLEVLLVLLPVVPVAPDGAFCRQPVTVMFFEAESLVLVWLGGVVGGFCAASPATRPSVIAAHVPDHSLFLILTS